VARPRHPVRELEAILKEAEERGWLVTRGNGYFKMACPCADKHLTWVHLTPSDSRYGRNKRSWLASRTCWNEEQR
jgi:hypothetical protein